MYLLASQPSLGLVVGLGIGMVFFGLICIILLCYILGAVIRFFEGSKPAAPATAAEAKTAAPVRGESIAKNSALIAAISAAIAEDMGKDVSAIRIKSIKKL